MYNNFYEIAVELLGDLPPQFEFAYAVVAIILTLAFFYILFAFISGFMRKIGRW